ncbi:MAG: ATP-binding domain-containing protein [Myxococcales bacterium]|nr:ATP-binding domain-containing protein [Myxococcales bacterium]
MPGLEGDEEGQRIVAEELRLLEVVLGAVEAHRTKAAASGGEESLAAALADADARLLDLREQAATAKPEDLPPLLEQMHHLAALRGQRGRSSSMPPDTKSPYFGHLRLIEQVDAPGRGPAKERRRDVLIGSRSYLDSGAGVRIVDWRNAPVSRIFYRYREDDAFEEQLGDQHVEGTVAARRTVAIVDGELKKVTSPAGTFIKGEDGLWRRAAAYTARLRLPSDRSAAPAAAAATGAAATAGAKTAEERLLPAIAAMLDASQYELITAPGAGVVAIQGSAGSGKTTVGLHRVAYLHANDPRRYRADRLLVVVPSEALIHYTCRVLPGLGVDGVPVTTFARWSVRALGDLFPKLPSAMSDATPPVVARLKSHARMLDAIDAVASEALARVERRLSASMERWPGGDTVIAAFEATKGAPDRRVSDLSLWYTGKKQLPGVGDASALPEVTKSALEALGRELRGETRAVLSAWDEILTSRERLERHFGGAFGAGQLDQVHEWCVRQSRVRAEGERDGETPTLDTEDRALILRIFQAMRGTLVDFDGHPLTVAHLFVDEVQDASPVELRVLLGLASSSDGLALDPAKVSVTLAGDTAQRMLDDGDDRGELDWGEMLATLGIDVGAGKLEPLKVSYRSTAEITAFARGVLGPLAHEAEPIATRRGPPVEHFGFASPGEGVAFLADALRDLAVTEPEANVALLARFPQQADVYYEGLLRAEVPNVRRVKKQDFTWERGFDVTDVRQTKGLEFDEVILLETTSASYPETPQARHALYVAATRAAHQLWCTASDTPSALVNAGLAAVDQLETDAG